MTEYQSCWEILGIDPIRNKKSIKRAYAKHLKTTRPDDNPEGFKRLHTAYTECLDYLDYDWFWETDEDDSTEIETISDFEQPNGQPLTEGVNEADNQKNDTDEPIINQPPIATPINKAAILETEVATEKTIEETTEKTREITTGTDTDTDTEQNADTQKHELVGEVLPDEAVPDNNHELVINTVFDHRTNNHSYETLYDDNLYDLQQACANKLSALVANPVTRDNITIWQAALADEALYDINFKQQVSMLVLSEILDLRAKQLADFENLNNIPPSFISQPTLVFISHFFGWQHAQEKIEQEFYFHEALNQFYDDLEAPDAPIINEFTPEQDGSPETVIDKEAMANQLGLATIFIRHVSLILDAGFVALFWYIFTLIDTYWMSLPVAILVMLVWALLLVLQASPLCATVGQYACGLKLVSIHNERVDFLSVLMRHFTLLFMLCIVLFSMSKMFGFVLWGTYVIYKYNNKSNFTWLDDDSNTCVIYAKTRNAT